MTSIGLPKVIITSGIRPPERQAKTMYQNILAKGVESQLGLYAAPGREVVKVYVSKRQTGSSEDAIIAAMTEKIIDLSNAGKRVSKHCVSESFYAKLNVIDVSHDRMPASKRSAFELEITKAVSKGRIEKFLSPGKKSGERAYHLEIPQP